MADHGEVKIREKKVVDLIDLYKAAYIEIVATIETATEAGKIRKARTMAQINKILTGLGVDVKAWVDSEIPKYYLDGSNSALNDLRELGVDIDASSMSLINKEAIATLVDETSLAFAQGITGISRSANQILSNAIKQQINSTIALGQLTGETRKIIAQQVVQDLRQNGLTAIVDRRGVQWTFDRYADMLVRTKAVEARNIGMQNRMLQNGYDLVQVTNHNSVHRECAKYEGKILSLTGKTPVGTDLGGGYKVFATYDKAKADGIFHPNCQHGINPFSPSLAAKTKAYDNPYNYLSREEYIARFPDSPEAKAEAKAAKQ